MNCREVQPLLVAYLDGEVTPSEQELVQAHLAECEDCREEVALLTVLQQQVRRTLRGEVEEAAPSPEVWEQLQARLTREEGGPMKRVHQFFTGAQAVAGVAVILLLALVAVLVLSPDRRASTAASQIPNAGAADTVPAAPPAPAVDAAAPAPASAGEPSGAEETDSPDAQPPTGDNRGAGPEMRTVAGLRYLVWPGTQCGQDHPVEPMPTPNEEELQEQLEQFHAQEQPITLEEAQALPFGVPAWAPEGFELKTMRDVGTMVFLTWKDSYQQSISFIAVPFEPNGMPMPQRGPIPVVEGAVQEVEVNGRPAALLLGICNMSGVNGGGLGFWDDRDTYAHMNWTSTTRPFSYSLSKHANEISVSAEDLIQMAESVP
ncbi:MAG TPA: zf-HC2 domain-containing protein [Ardenticatenaceae bacterium]